MVVSDGKLGYHLKICVLVAATKKSDCGYGRRMVIQCCLEAEKLKQNYK